MPADPDSTSSSLPTLLLLLPLLSALVILLAHRLLKGACVAISLFSSLVCLLISLMLLGTKDSMPLLLPFIEVGEIKIAIDAIIDQQSRGMMFIVTSIGFFVHLFSVGYMKEDESRERFFGSLSLFMFSMTGIVLSGNLFMMFIFWELVGLSSYLLIGHWFGKASAAEASKKAFLTNRIGDFGFMIGILMLFMANHNDVSFAGLKESFAMGTIHDAIKLHPTFYTIAALCIFMGAVGKSAQFPLHVWLPDAMEGPTPVSALIHAATMVAAGVYMLVRCAFVIEASPDASVTIAWIGGITALMAALIATQQNDIKRVLAYSTLSQLGYMVMAVGLVAMQAAGSHHDAAAPGHPAMFHLYTHAFFKAMLFLGSGAVIYACHHEQDIWKMGGLAKHMPVTFFTFALGTASLMGVPWITSGFWSKETILGVGFEACRPLFWVGVMTAGLTAFYMTRMLVVSFLGKPRTESAHHATEAPIVMLLPLVFLAILTVISTVTKFNGMLQAMEPHHAEPHITVLVASIGVLVIGSGLGFLLYKGKESDPLASNGLAKIFANKFYFDELYAVIVKVLQDGLAWIVTGIERIFVDGIVARLPAFAVRRFGAAARALTGGHLQGYTFVLGAGLLLVIYLLVFVLPQPGH